MTDETPKKVCRTPGCGHVIEGRGRNAVYCEECARIRKNAQRHARMLEEARFRREHAVKSEERKIHYDTDFKYYYHHKPKQVLVQGGWRGQKVAGGNCINRGRMLREF